MNRRRFGRISLLVTATLAVLLAVQAWSLASMYRDRREEFSRQVMQAMTRAAYDDLLLGNKPTERKSLVTFSSSGNIDSIRVDMIQEISVKNLGGSGKSLSFTPKSDTIHHDISISNGETTRYIRQEIHIPPVYVLRLNMARYDSLLSCNLAAAGIDLPHKVDVVRGPTDSTSSVKLFTAKPLTDPEVVVTALNDSLRLKDPLTFTTSLTTDDELYFRLRIENPDRQLLRDMAGVIGSSLMMLAAVAGVLIYLLRTLFRQKTLEEMRRDLTHNITHELKTPIAVANAANDALLDFGAADDATRRARYLRVIREQLAALVGLQRRDAHLGRNLDDALQDGGVVVLHGGVGVFFQQAVRGQLGDAGVGEIRVNGAGAVAQKRRKVVDFARLARLQNEGQRRAFFRLDQVLVHGRHRQQRGDGDTALVDAAVGEDQHVGPVAVGFVHLDKQVFQRGFQRRALVVQNGHTDHAEAGAVHRLDF